MSRLRSRLSILHVAQPTAGGVAVSAATLARDQAERGWEVAVASPPDGELGSWLAEAGIHHVPWPVSRNPGRLLASETMRLRQVVAARRPSLVHLHSSKAGLAGRLAVRGAITTVFQPHGWSFHALRPPLSTAAARWEKLAARWTHVTVCVSERERAEGRRAGLRGFMRLVPNGVDLKRFTVATPEEKAAARTQLGVPASPTAVCAGRLTRQKGQTLLVDAWSAVRERVPNAELVLVGSGPDFRKLKGREAPGVRLVGWSDDVRPWFAAADVVVMPSRWEGMSFVMLEAMACGRSIVATDVQGVREALAKQAGAIVPVDDAASVVEALVRRLEEPELARREGESGRRRVEGLYELERWTDGIAAVYLELLDAPR